MEPALTLDESIAVSRLHALLELLPSALDRELAAEGITSFEHRLLAALQASEGRRMRLSTLAAITNATLPRLSRVVTGLERKGLVERAPCAEDGRATNAVLTDAGLATYERTAPRYAAAVRRLVLAGLDEAGVDSLAATTLAVLTNLDPDAGAKAREAGAPCAADAPTACAADLAG